MIEAALDYIKEGFKVFPVKLDKKPLTEHGLKDATQTQQGVKEYWTKWPDAGIGIVTDNLVVLDFDAKSGGLDSMELIKTKFGLPDTRLHGTGGGGFHYIYLNPNGTNVRNATGLGGYPGVDLRANGGYIVAPPSHHPSGNDYYTHCYTTPVIAPQWLMTMATKRPEITNAAPVDGESIPEGQRNAILTKMAGAMRRQGMTAEEIEAALLAANKRCQPGPLSESEIRTIAKSVSRYQPVSNGYNVNTYTREGVIGGGNGYGSEIPASDTENMQRALQNRFNPYPIMSNVSSVASVANVSQDIVKDYISESNGQWIEYRDLDSDLGIRTPEQKSYRRSVIMRLLADKIIEKHPSINTKIRFLNNHVEDMVLDFEKPSNYLSLKFPFGIEDKVDVYHKSLSVIAGTKEAGKTAFCLNVAKNNCDIVKVHYFNSEMGDVELMNRLRNFEDYREWVNKVHWVERSNGFEDVIYPDDMNIIDFLEINQEFYLIGGLLSAIYRKLNKGIAIIALQKDPRTQYGRGGTFGLEKARLYVTLNHQSGVNTATIEAGKMWHNEMDNPRGQYVNYKIVKGCIFTNVTSWKQPQYKKEVY